MSAYDPVSTSQEGLKFNLDPKELFEFPLDEFQMQAIDALNQGYSVVVSAPTGSGKTFGLNCAVTMVATKKTVVITFVFSAFFICPFRNIIFSIYL